MLEAPPLSALCFCLLIRVLGWAPKLSRTISFGDRAQPGRYTQKVTSWEVTHPKAVGSRCLIPEPLGHWVPQGSSPPSQTSVDAALPAAHLLGSRKSVSVGGLYSLRSLLFKVRPAALFLITGLCPCPWLHPGLLEPLEMLLLCFSLETLFIKGEAASRVEAELGCQATVWL
jgi:hypothetical protein